MDELIISLVIIFLGITFIPPVARRIQIPVIVIEIIFGILIGKSLFDLIPDSQVFDFFHSFGLVYLMFLVGIEIDLTYIRGYIVKTTTIALASVSIPFLSGYILSSSVNVHPLLLGTILSTTSLAIVLPLVKDVRFEKRFSQVLLSSVFLVDVISMFLLAFSLSTIQGLLRMELVYSFIAVLALFLLPWLVNTRIFHERIERRLSKESYSDLEVRLGFALIFLFVALTGKLGFHSIIGAFIAGLLISGVIPKTSAINEKLKSFGYGFFIPLFFIFTGAKVDIPYLFSNVENIGIMLLIIGVGIFSKLIGVFVVTKLNGFNIRESTAFCLFHSARLSLIIAAVNIARELDLIDNNLFSIFVILTVVTATILPIIARYIMTTGQKSDRVTSL